MKNLASNALSFMYYKMQYAKNVIILFDFLLGLCVVLDFFSNSMYFGPHGCLEVGEHCALSLLQIVKLGCFEEVASYIHLFVGKLQQFWSIPIMYVLLDVWDMVLHVLHFISFHLHPWKIAKKTKEKKLAHILLQWSLETSRLHTCTQVSQAKLVS